MKHWWRASKEAVLLASTIVVWGGFVKVFFGKYFLDYARDKRMMKFMGMKQNDLIVDP